MAQMRINAYKNLPVNNLLQPLYIQPLQTLLPGEQFQEVQAEQASDKSTSSQPKTLTQNNDDTTVLDELENHYNGELSGFKPNLKTASKIVPDIFVLESPQQHQPNSQMVSNTCFKLIIHHDFEPYHLNAITIIFSLELH